MENTAKKAKEFGSSFNNGDFAYICGLLHDIGKYSEEFQDKIKNNSNRRVDHSTAGAIEVNKMNELTGKLMAYCIAGHHGGLPDGGNKSDTATESTLIGRLKRIEKVPDYLNFKKEIKEDLFLGNLPNIKPINKGGFSLAFFIRMIYSCLVDSDFLDTEKFMNYDSIDRTFSYDFGHFKELLNIYIGNFKQKERKINLKRSEILNNCIEKSCLDKGLFTLTVPTGGGKTVSSLAFAISHAIKHNMSRVIYVIPYTSIIEQNAKIFKNILGQANILEHHSNFDFNNNEDLLFNKLRLASENWDIPIIVTTNVQFFESLFSNKPSKCRKLHNIANSVIIFDEAQMIPIEYLTPCIMAITELVVSYNSTCVLCSATQPSLKSRFPKEVHISELCEKTDSLYNFFRRTKVINKGRLDLIKLSNEFNNCKQVLCIVNSKKHALSIYSELKGEGVFHLSTRMCPYHRTKMINEIKLRLEKDLTCKVISTQLIEAGVDVDFPTVYRELAGIDSIVQAAGRCNREGKLEIGYVYIFEPESLYTKNMPTSIKRPIEVSKNVLRRYEDIISPEAIKSYFDELYSFEGKEGLDIKNIYDDMERGAINCNFNFNFKQISEKFKLIEDITIPVIVGYDKKAKTIIEKLRYMEKNKSILRAVQTYTVNVYSQEFDKMQGANLIEIVDDGIYVLRDGDKYKKDTGLEFTIETGVGIFV